MPMLYRRFEHPIPYAVVLGILLASVLAFVFEPHLRYGYDESGYVIAAQALAQGQGLVYTNDPSRPLANPHGIAFPISMAQVFKIGGQDNFIAGKLVVAGMCLLLSLGFYAWLLKGLELPPLPAFGLAAAFGTHPITLSFSHQLMSDLPYALFSLAALALVSKSARQGLWIGAGVLSVLALYTRSIGLTLIVAVCAYGLATKRHKLLIAYLLAVLGAIGGVILALGPSLGNPMARYGYTSGIAGRIGVALENAWTYALGLGRVIAPFPYDAIGHMGFHETWTGKLILLAFSMLLLALVAAGLGRLWERSRISFLYLAAYISVLLLWPGVDVNRFLLPVLPILLLLLYWSLHHLAWANLGMGLLISCNLAYVAWQGGVKNRNVFSFYPLRHSVEAYEPGRREYYEAALWAKANLPHTSLIATRSAYDFFLWSACLTSEFDWVAGDPSSVRNGLQAADFVVEDSYWPQTRELVTPLIQGAPERFQLLHVTGGAKPAKLYRVVK